MKNSIRNNTANVPRDLERLAGLLDNLFKIPGTNISVGLDAIIGLVPGVGDALSFLASSFIVHKAAVLGVPKLILTKMSLNILLDTVLGSFPLLGDLFDIVFRANLKNLEMLKSLDANSFHPRTNRDVLILIKITAIIVVSLILAVLMLFISVIWKAIASLQI